METSSDRRLFGMCVLASLLGFVIWLLILPEANVTWIFGIAILALTAMRFIDGYLAAT